jgi:hypothetical protein
MGSWFCTQSTPSLLPSWLLTRKFNACISDDIETGGGPFRATEMELRWIEHRASSGRRQWSHPIVRGKLQYMCYSSLHIKSILDLYMCYAIYVFPILFQPTGYIQGPIPRRQQHHSTVHFPTCIIHFWIFFYAAILKGSIVDSFTCFLHVQSGMWVKMIFFCLSGYVWHVHTTRGTHPYQQTRQGCTNFQWPKGFFASAMVIMRWAPVCRAKACCSFTSLYSPTDCRVEKSSFLGLESNRSTLWCRETWTGLLAGLLEGTLAPRYCTKKIDLLYKNKA